MFGPSPETRTMRSCRPLVVRAWRSLGVAAVESLIESLFGVADETTERHLLPAIDEADAAKPGE